MRILIIHNPKSGSGQDDIYTYIRALLSLEIHEVVMRPLINDIPLSKLLEDAHEFDVVVASGGDGTVTNVNGYLKNTGIPLLAFPSGTANSIASNLGYSLEPVAMAKATLAKRTTTIDSGTMTYTTEDGTKVKKSLALIAGAGFDAKLLADAEEYKSNFGTVAYFAAALANTTPQKSHFTLTLDGEVHKTDGIGVLVVNFGTLPYDIDLISGSDPRDGLFDIVVIHTSSTVELLPTIISALLDKNGSFPYRPQLEVFRARSITVECDPPLIMQYDGEVIENATTPFTIEMEPRVSTFIIDETSEFAHETISEQLKR